jgi:hypothetical protein
MKKIDAKGDGPHWTALVRKSDGQVMIAFVGSGEPALGMVSIFLRAVGRRIPRSDLVLVEMNAHFRVVEATDIGTRFKIFEAGREAAERASDAWIRKGGAA